MGQLFQRARVLAAEIEHPAVQKDYVRLATLKSEVASQMITVLRDRDHPIHEKVHALVEGRMDENRHIALLIPRPSARTRTRDAKEWPIRLLLLLTAHTREGREALADTIGEDLVPEDMIPPTAQQSEYVLNRARTETTKHWIPPASMPYYILKAIEWFDTTFPQPAFELELRIQGTQVTYESLSFDLKNAPKILALLQILNEHRGSPVTYTALREADINHPPKTKKRLLEQCEERGLLLTITGALKSYTLTDISLSRTSPAR